jgi:phosphoribosylanthranilate isomerase
VVEIKFCGLTRPADAEYAASLGARYVGVVLAGGPRNLSIDRAREVLDAAGDHVRRAAVFGARPAREIVAIADELSLDIVQLHADPTPADVTAVHARFDVHVWAACRVGESGVPPGAMDLAAVADAVVLDRLSPSGLGGTGQTLPWKDLSVALAPIRGDMTLVLAGGLRPENIGEAIKLMRPDVVDVSSGVESAPGVKDHGRMRAFAAAVAPRGADA